MVSVDVFGMTVSQVLSIVKIDFESRSLTVFTEETSLAGKTVSIDITPELSLAEPEGIKILRIKILFTKKESPSFVKSEPPSFNMREFAAGALTCCKEQDIAWSITLPSL